MKQVIIECKRIDEWDPETRNKIVEKHRDINVADITWWEGVYENWAEKLEKMGYDITDVEFYDKHKYNQETGKREKTGEKGKRTVYNINFSGFHSQGDGASFTCQSVDITKWLKYQNNPKYKRILKLLENSVRSDLEYSAEIKRTTYHYYHENTVSLILQWYPDKVYDMPNILSLLEDIEKDMDEDIRTQCRAIYDDLEEEYRYMTSDEAVRGTLEAYEFDQNGEIY